MRSVLAVAAAAPALTPYVEGSPSLGAGRVSRITPVASVVSVSSTTWVTPQAGESSAVPGGKTCGERTTWTATACPAASSPARRAVTVRAIGASDGQAVVHEAAMASATSPLPSTWIVAPPLAPAALARIVALPAGASGGIAKAVVNAPARSSVARVVAKVRPRTARLSATSPAAGR